MCTQFPFLRSLNAITFFFLPKTPLSFGKKRTRANAPKKYNQNASEKWIQHHLLFAAERDWSIKMCTESKTINIKGHLFHFKCCCGCCWCNVTRPFTLIFEYLNLKPIWHWIFDFIELEHVHALHHHHRSHYYLPINALHCIYTHCPMYDSQYTYSRFLYTKIVFNFRSSCSKWYDVNRAARDFFPKKKERNERETRDDSVYTCFYESFFPRHCCSRCKPWTKSQLNTICLKHKLKIIPWARRRRRRNKEKLYEANGFGCLFVGTGTLTLWGIGHVIKDTIRWHSSQMHCDKKFQLKLPPPAARSLQNTNMDTEKVRNFFAKWSLNE